MDGYRLLNFQTICGRLRNATVGVVLCLCCFVSTNSALAQQSSSQNATTVQSPSAPPLNPPQGGVLPTGNGALSIGDWILSPTLGLYTLYDSNIHSSPTAPLSGPGFHFHPSLSADYNTGIHDTLLYGNIDSVVYPTINYLNNTFDRQAGAIEKYSPLPDLVFTVQGDYTHRTNANVLTQSIPAPVSSGSPPPSGAEGVIATQQTVVDPNDTYTLSTSVYKEFNRAFVRLGASAIRVDYETEPTSNYTRQVYDGSGGMWVTPQVYIFADGLLSPAQPVVGADSSNFRTRAGIGTGQIGFFQGSIYGGWQGFQADGEGTAGGDIYGGLVSYAPTVPWNMTVSVDRLRNISNITSGTPLAIGGLPLTGVGIPTNASTQITTISFKSNYVFSVQTSVYGVVSDTLINYIDSPRTDTSWFASVGIRHQVRDNLSLTLDYQYSRLISDQPLTSFTRNLVSLGAIYNF